jgi:CheY-like chemotaxis protein
LGQGTEFVVRLPLSGSPASAPAPPAGSSISAVPPLRILIAEDNDDMADSLATILQGFGHEVRIAKTGPSALKTALALLPHLVLLDIGLPEMDGHEVARRLRQHPRLKDTQLIALTGYDQDSDRERSQAAGFDLHLVKPLDPSILREVVTAVAGRLSSAPTTE